MPKRPLVSQALKDKLRALLTAQRSTTDIPVDRSEARMGTTGPQPSDEALDIIKRHEGFRSQAYLDPVGKWTIGYGQATPDIRPGMTTTRDEALEFVKQRLQDDSTRLARKGIPVSGGLLSFMYNLGEPKTMRYGLPAAIQRGDYDEAERIIAATVYGKGKYLAGLPARRKEEIASVRRSQSDAQRILGLP